MRYEIPNWVRTPLKRAFAANSYREEVLDDALAGEDPRIDLAQPRDLNFKSVIDWSDWQGIAKRNGARLLGRSPDGAFYGGVSKRLSALENLTTTHIVDGWQCDIQAVNGLANSKSDLKAFTSLDDMVESNAPDLIQEISPAALNKNLAWGEIRIIHRQEAPETLLQFDWQPGRTYLMNSGGSHHFAAAQYIATRLQARVPLTGKLMRLSINAKALDEIDHGYSVFAIRRSDAWWRLVHAMETLRTEFYWFDLPTRHCGYAMFLPKDNPRSQQVARSLSNRSFSSIVDALRPFAR